MTDMRIPISPQEIVNAVVGNNPAAVQENMLRHGLIPSSASVLTPQTFMEMLSNLGTDSRAQAVSLIGKLFNIQIDNNGYAAAWLYQMTTNYSMSLEQLTSSIFADYLPQEVPRLQSQGENTTVRSELGSGCGCSKGKIKDKTLANKPMSNAAAPMTTAQKVFGVMVLGFAIFGLISLLALSVRVLQKLSKN
jgi:hypothetical protein